MSSRPIFRIADFTAQLLGARQQRHLLTIVNGRMEKTANRATSCSSSHRETPGSS